MSAEKKAEITAKRVVYKSANPSGSAMLIANQDDFTDDFWTMLDKKYGK